jgi:peptidoglycan/xylan/chitin deacetylase (PgdA/CDA1 family)
VLSVLKRVARDFLTRNEVSVLNYHGVIGEGFPFSLPYQLPEARFREQMEYLARNRSCVTTGQLCEMLETGRSGVKKAVAITFDDGFANNLYRALPILEEYAIPATVFVATEYVGERKVLWPERLAIALACLSREEVLIGGETLSVATNAGKAEAYMAFTRYAKTREDSSASAVLEEFFEDNDIRGHKDSEPAYFDDLRMLDRQELGRLADHELITIGSHTCNHSRLSQVGPDRSKSEIVESRRWLGEAVQEVSYFAYPFGGYGADFDDTHVSIVRDSGYRAAFAVGAGGASRRSNLYRIPRTNVTSEIDLPGFAYLAEGGSSQLHAGSPVSVAQGLISGAVAQVDDR